MQLSSQAELEGNLRVVGELVARAAARGAELVVLPENFAYFGSDTGRAAHAETIGADGPIQSALVGLARTYGIALIAGGFPERSADPARPYNTCLALDASGVVAGSYRKVHLFNASVPGGGEYHESAATTAGASPVVVELMGVRVGLSICYDLRFPELYRALADLGAEVLVVPAAFTAVTGEAHWEVLVRARAIENQAWVLAAAQWGEHPGGRRCHGHSSIVDPWGSIVAQIERGAEVVVAELDRSRLSEVRARLPALRHRRLR